MNGGKLQITARDITRIKELVTDALAQAGLEPGLHYSITEHEQNSIGDSQDGDRQHYFLDEMAKLNNDLTNMQRQLAKANTELAHLAEVRNRFVGMAAHDLRNPLGVPKTSVTI
jgi:signal transduction histidine kinase